MSNEYTILDHSVKLELLDGAPENLTETARRMTIRRLIEALGPAVAPFHLYTPYPHSVLILRGGTETDVHMLIEALRAVAPQFVGVRMVHTYTSSHGTSRKTLETVISATVMTTKRPALRGFTKWDPLGPYSAYKIAWRGELFPTAQHALGWEYAKEVFPAAADMIREAFSAREADMRARLVPVSAVAQAGWERRRVQVMREIITAKAMKHEHIREVLVRTDSEALIFLSDDDFWGDGGGLSEEPGKNHLGVLWKELKDKLA